MYKLFFTNNISNILFNIQHYKVRLKDKVEQSREEVAPSTTHQCSSFWKESLQVTLDSGRQIDFFFVYCQIGWGCKIHWLHRCNPIYTKLNEIHIFKRIDNTSGLCLEDNFKILE